MPPPAKNAKPIWKTSSPFTETRWPEIPHDDQEIILDLLCNLISPLGDHRKTHIHPSKGQKRKRTTKETQNVDTPPPPPEISKHIVIGINSITRHLEALAAKTAPSTMPIHSEDKQTTQNDTRPLSLVVLTHPKPSSSPHHAHFPTLIHLNSAPASRAPRLLPLSISSDARLAAALHIPRVGALAICDGAPGAKALEEFVREKVDVTECAWIDEAMGAEWRGVNVKVG